MEDRMNIRDITPETPDWTCKVQLIEKGRPRLSKDGRTRFQTGVVQDETEEQVGVVLYGGDIEKYERKINFIPFHTYLITTAKVRQPLPYGIPVNRFEWVLDRFTIVKQLKEDNMEDPPLLPPTRLNIVPLTKATLDQQPLHTEFDILATVVCCGSITNAGNQGNKCRQTIVVDTNMHPSYLILWEDFAEIDGNKLAAQIAEYPVILAKRIARATYSGGSLTTRYSSVILINPFYGQAAELMNWVNDNKEMLNDYRQRSCPDGTLSPILLPLREEIVAIANIKSQPTMQSFDVEGKMSLLDGDEQSFYELICSKCKNFVRSKRILDAICVNCDEDVTLIPRCRFQVQITDGSGSTIATMLGESAENLLCMKAEQIYDISKIKKEPLPLDPVRDYLANKIFKVQLRKSFSRASDQTPAKLLILSYAEKHNTPQLSAPSSSTAVSISHHEKTDNLSSEEEEHEEIILQNALSRKRELTEGTISTTKASPSNIKLEIAPLTPAKKK